MGVFDIKLREPDSVPVPSPGRVHLFINALTNSITGKKADNTIFEAGGVGPAGAKGDKGDTGAAGANGAQGIQGVPGATGAQGVPPSRLLCTQRSISTSTKSSILRRYQVSLLPNLSSC